MKEVDTVEAFLARGGSVKKVTSEDVAAQLVDWNKRSKIKGGHFRARDREAARAKAMREKGT